MAPAPTFTEALREPANAEALAGRRPAWAEIDLDALTANLAVLRRRLAGTRVLAVIKADAYGHGAPQVARCLAAAGVEWLGVALVEEGAAVRRSGVELPILVLGVAMPGQLPLYRQFGLTPTVSGLDQLQLWCEYLDGAAETQPIHLKVDTGMRRLGIAMGELGEALGRIRRHPRLQLAGVFSHFADADLLDSPRNALQESRFDEVLAALTAAERERALVHLANSAGALHRPGSRHDLVRLGLALYGHDPVGGNAAGLTPVMAVKARIVLLRDLPAGAHAGYGGRWEAQRPSRVAIVPVGYADGYPWRLSPHGEVLVAGQRVPFAGAVSMDMSFVDVTDVPAAVGDEVVLLGRQGAAAITVDQLATRAGTIPWELLCLLGLRLDRRYLQGGRVNEIASRFPGGPA